MLQEAILHAYAQHEKRIYDALELERPLVSAEQRRRLDYFQTWCAKQGVRSLPATPGTVAAYIAAIPEIEIPDALDAIQAAHDYVAQSSPVGSFAVRSVLSARLTSIAPPRSFSKEDSFWFTVAPIELQQIVARRERERDTALRRSQNALAEEKKRLQNGADNKSVTEKEVEK
jgi:hypothetical protein